MQKFGIVAHVGMYSSLRKLKTISNSKELFQRFKNRNRQFRLSNNLILKTFWVPKCPPGQILVQNYAGLILKGSERGSKCGWHWISFSLIRSPLGVAKNRKLDPGMIWLEFLVEFWQTITKILTAECSAKRFAETLIVKFVMPNLSNVYEGLCNQLSCLLVCRGSDLFTTDFLHNDA